MSFHRIEWHTLRSCDEIKIYRSDHAFVLTRSVRVFIGVCVCVCVCVFVWELHIQMIDVLKLCIWVIVNLCLFCIVENIENIYAKISCFLHVLFTFLVVFRMIMYQEGCHNRQYLVRIVFLCEKHNMYIFFRINNIIKDFSV